MKTYTYKKSVALFDRAVQVIPCGIYGHLSPAPLVPVEHYPFYMARAKGARFWDVDGNEFIDYLCAYGPMVLGYNDPRVDAAAKAQLEKGNCVTAPGTAMVELAEALVDLVDGMSWAFFAKNGGDITSYSLMVARAATGRKKIILVRGGYHGVAPWAQPMGHAGIMQEDKDLYLYVDWNDFEGFQKVVKENRGQIAGFISTPYHHPTFQDSVMPAEGYWKSIETLCRKEGIVIIVDDVRCGFRLDLAGSHKYFGFNPDLVCYCKAIANGYPIAAVVGKKEVLQVSRPDTKLGSIGGFGGVIFGGTVIPSLRSWAQRRCAMRAQRFSTPGVTGTPRFPWRRRSRVSRSSSASTLRPC